MYQKDYIELIVRNAVSLYAAKNNLTLEPDEADKDLADVVQLIGTSLDNLNVTIMPRFDCRSCYSETSVVFNTLENVFLCVKCYAKSDLIDRNGNVIRLNKEQKDNAR